MYAWTSANGRQLNLIMDIVGRTFSDKLQYVFHIDSGRKFGKATGTTSIVCRFPAANTVECRVVGVDCARGSASGPEGLDGRQHRFRVFAEAIAPNGTVIDLRDSLHLAGNTEDGDFRLLNPGAYVLMLETDDRAQSHLPAIRFNDYVRAEGLTPALEQRERTHRMDADGSENYSRLAKSIVQVGTPDAGSQTQVTKPLGLSLEIVPERSPYTEPLLATLPVRVIYLGQPLAGALVKLTNLEHDAAPVEMRLTDRAGRASFTMPHDGTWLLNVIWTTPQPLSRETDFETIFSSLSFGFTSSP
jgi:hypothetical protein